MENWSPMSWMMMINFESVIDITRFCFFVQLFISFSSFCFILFHLLCFVFLFCFCFCFLFAFFCFVWNERKFWTLKLNYFFLVVFIQVSLKQELKVWEKSFMKENGTKPTAPQIASDKKIGINTTPDINSQIIKIKINIKIIIRYQHQISKKK